MLGSACFNSPSLVPPGRNITPLALYCFRGDYGIFLQLPMPLLIDTPQVSPNSACVSLQLKSHISAKMNTSTKGAEHNINLWAGYWVWRYRRAHCMDRFCELGGAVAAARASGRRCVDSVASSIVASRGIPWLLVACRCLLWPPKSSCYPTWSLVISLCLSWSPVVSCRLSWCRVAFSLPF